MPQSPFDIPSMTDPEIGALHVITVNYNSPGEVATLIRSFADVSCITKFWVVDHFDTDELVFPSVPFPVEVIKQPNRGYAAGLNAGIKRVEDPSAIILMCNPDVTLVNPDGVERAMGLFEHAERLGLLLPALELPDSTPILSCQRFYSLRTSCSALLDQLGMPLPQILEGRFYPTSSVKPLEVDWGSGAVMMARRSVFQQTQGLDERFFLYFEDVDLCARVWQAGLKVILYSLLVFQHKPRHLSRGKFLYFAIHIRSLMQFLWKYGGFVTRSDVLWGAATCHTEKRVWSKFQ